jgi:hypothetical protein
MEDFDKILLTGAVTILGGFFIHSASQLFLKLFIEPLQRYRQYKFEAVALLSFYSNMLSARLRGDENQGYRDGYYKAQDEIRMCMANIKAAYYSISPRWLAILFRVIPGQAQFKKVTRNLLALSFLGQLITEKDDISKNMDLAELTVTILGAEW